MKTQQILRMVAMIFVIVTAVLLTLLVLNVISSQDVKDGVIKLAALCGIIGATSLVMAQLNKK